MITVGKLRGYLNDLPDDMEIIMQKDAEGNDYSPLYTLDSECVYKPENSWSGEVYSLYSSHEDVCLSPFEWTELSRGPKVLVLVPVN